MANASIIRTPAARAASVARIAYGDEAYILHGERLDDAERLRKALVAKRVIVSPSSRPHVPAIWNPVVNQAQRDAHLYIARVCAWAVERMKAADARWAERPVELGRAA